MTLPGLCREVFHHLVGIPLLQQYCYLLLRDRDLSAKIEFNSNNMDNVMVM